MSHLCRLGDTRPMISMLSNSPTVDMQPMPAGGFRRQQLELRKMLLRALSTVAFAAGFTATAALADGMPSYSGAYTPVFSWTGFYIGANVGWERKHMVGS